MGAASTEASSNFSELISQTGDDADQLLSMSESDVVMLMISWEDT